MNASIITIGDEILIGQIIDTNSAWLGSELVYEGISIRQIVSISDDVTAIQTTLREQMEKSDLIIMTGGLGPTKDDVTKKALAEYFGAEMVFIASAYNRIRIYFDSRGIPVLEAHKEQCYMPSNARILDNGMGTAPGMLFESDGKLILSVPGVPYEMKWIYNNQFLPLLREIFPSKNHIFHKTIKTVGKGESRIADEIKDIVENLPDHISFAYLPSIGSVRLRLSSVSEEDHTKQVLHYSDRITDRLGKIIYGYDDQSLEGSIIDLYKEKNLSIATAESCTGGYVAHRLTAVPGSSAVYQGSVVAYSYPLKERLLGVSDETLVKHGAVSEETVIEMLNGLLDNLGADVGVSISGIAGPGGGTEDKPVGTIWLAWGSKGDIKTKKLNLAKDRRLNIQYTGVAALNALRLYAIELP